MRYQVEGRTIKSHNSALSPARPNPLVLDWIGGLQPELTAVDFGCGKLRHFLPLAARVTRVVGIDSQEQLERVTLFEGRPTSVRDYVLQNVKNGRIYPVEGRAWRRHRVDVGLCTNVLSAIPCRATRREVLSGLRYVLRPGGRALITTHYHNDKFMAFANRPSTRSYLDGYLIENGKRTHFYGIIPPSSLRAECRGAGFRVVKDLSTYRWACLVCEA